MLSGSISDEEYGKIEQQYCKHAIVAKTICCDYSASMKKSDINFDLSHHSEIYSFMAPAGTETEWSSLKTKMEELTIVYPALNLKGDFEFVQMRFSKVPKSGLWFSIGWQEEEFCILVVGED